MARNNRHKYLINAAVFVLMETASLWILSNSSDFHKSWIGSVMASFSAGTWGQIDNILSYFELREQNDRLALENFELTQAMQQMSDSLARTDVTWKKQRGNFEYMPCTVVTKSNNSQHNYLVVDRGYADGVEDGDGIVTAKGVIGVVHGISEHYSMAISIDNNDMTVSAKIGEEGFVGSLSWDGIHSNGALLKGIPLHAKVETGDTVSTSGFSSIFPADIPLATVKEIKVRNGSAAEIILELFEDFSKIRYAMIVKNRDRKELEELTQ